MSSGAAVPTGNTYDKYGSTNPVVRRLMAGFERTLDDLFRIAAPATILDVGCGEGVLTEQWADRIDPAPPTRIVGIDLEDPKLGAEWARRRRPNLTFAAMEVEHLAFADGEFELVAATEVLEHVRQPQLALTEMARVASRYLLVSVPHEPWWRMLNMARGAYLRELGNTPGHLNHWTRRSFVNLLGRYGEVTEIRAPFPWTMLLVRVHA
ncbi:MAG: class I SAM-dependent methyltransferase [Solirubrobacteraceae bacterium]